jgi:hypothetical protein
VYQSGKYLDVKGGLVSVQGDLFNEPIESSPYLQYRLNFNESGNYYIFENANSPPKSMMFGTNTSNFAIINRLTETNGYLPIASEEFKAPVIYINSPGIHLLNFWKGNGSASNIVSLALHKVGSIVAVNLASPYTVKSSYDKFTTRFNISNPGISSVELLWKNSKSNESLRASKSLDFVSVKLGTILEVHPKG